VLAVPLQSCCSGAAMTISDWDLTSGVTRLHGGIELRLAVTAKEKEKTPITVNLQHTSLADAIGRVAEAADLDLMEKGNVIVLVPKKKAP
jgi:hypothetical protein